MTTRIRRWVRRIRWALFILPILAIGFTIYDFFNTAGDINNPNLQLTRMTPAEREYCLKTLWRIDSSSSERDVLAILGAPSRSLKYKKNWWVNLGGREDRVGVLFDSSGHAEELILDGGLGRFYYRRFCQGPRSDASRCSRVSQPGSVSTCLTRWRWKSGWSSSSAGAAVFWAGSSG
jgi:hypothetical protein